MRRHILMLWQTALIRLSRLKIQDEIETGLRYYPAAFFEVIPQVNAEVRAALQARWPDADLLRRADPAAGLVDRRRPRRQPERHRRRGAAGHRQRRLHGARALLRRAHRARARSCRCRRGWCTITDELAALADACDEPARADEPYRRALRVIHGRLTATAAEILDRQPEYAARPRPAALRDARRAPRRPRRRRRLAARQRQRACWPTTGWPGCGKRCDVFGFHLSGLDLRQNSDVHEEVVAELLAWAGRASPTTRRCREADRVELLAAELATRRPLIGAGRRAVGAGPQGTRHRRRGRPGGRAARPATRCRTTSSRCASRCRDMLEAARPAQGGRACWTPSRDRPYCPVGIVAAVRDHRRPAARRGDPRRGARPSAVPRAGRRPRRAARR